MNQVPNPNDLLQDPAQPRPKMSRRMAAELIRVCIDVAHGEGQGSDLDCAALAVLLSPIEQRPPMPELPPNRSVQWMFGSTCYRCPSCKTAFSGSYDGPADTWILHCMCCGLEISAVARGKLSCDRIAMIRTE
jgi:hypothetical protein